MANTVYQPHKSSLGGLDANVMAAICYGIAIVFSFIPFLRYLAWLAPLVVYFLEKSSPLVKFHSVQALILNAVGAVVSFVIFIISKIIVGAITPDTTDANYWLQYYTNNYASDLKKAATVAFIFGLIVWAVTIGIGVLQILSALSAYKYTENNIPVVSGIARKLSEKLSKVNLGGTGPATPPPSETWNPPAQGYTPPTQPYTPPAPPAQQWTAPGQPYTPPAPVAPPAKPAFDTQTGQPITPPEPPVEAPPAQKFDTETGLPIDD